MTRDFREDLKEVVHSVNMLFFGRGQLAEAQRTTPPARSDLEWLVIDYHLFAITHLLDYLCSRDGGLIRARLKPHGAWSTCFPLLMKCLESRSAAPRSAS